MILVISRVFTNFYCKPRTSGDDPTLLTEFFRVVK